MILASTTSTPSALSTVFMNPYRVPGSRVCSSLFQVIYAKLPFIISYTNTTNSVYIFEFKQVQNPLAGLCTCLNSQHTKYIISRCTAWKCVLSGSLAASTHSTAMGTARQPGQSTQHSSTSSHFTFCSPTNNSS